jgi:predicted dehydrogenase
MLRVAIVGVGWAGERQAHAVRELERKVAVTCLVDNDADFLHAKAGELGIARTYTNYQDALADPDVDAVSICTPHHLHCPMALEAAAAGKHILCEKPLAMNVTDATRMIDTAEANGVKLYVAENLCYTPMSHFLREVVGSGRHIGEPVAASMTFGFRARDFGYPGRRAWLTDPEQGGTGTWMLHGIHTMAQLRYILGEVASIYLQEHRARSFQRANLEATMTGIATLESGVNVTIVQTCEVRMLHNLGGYTLYGDEGCLRAYAEGYEVFSHTLNADEWPERRTYPAASLSDYAQEIEAFADWVLEDRPGPTTGRSERRSLAVVQAGYESMQSGQPVNIKARFGEI